MHMCSLLPLKQETETQAANSRRVPRNCVPRAHDTLTVHTLSDTLLSGGVYESVLVLASRDLVGNSPKGRSYSSNDVQCRMFFPQRFPICRWFELTPRSTRPLSTIPVQYRHDTHRDQTAGRSIDRLSRHSLGPADTHVHMQGCGVPSPGCPHAQICVEREPFRTHLPAALGWSCLVERRRSRRRECRHSDR